VGGCGYRIYEFGFWRLRGRSEYMIVIVLILDPVENYTWNEWI